MMECGVMEFHCAFIVDSLIILWGGLIGWRV